MKAYRFKVTLKGSSPPIWRRIEVPATMSFSGFDAILQELFGFDGSHLSSFDFPGAGFTLLSYKDEDAWTPSKLMSSKCLEDMEGYRKFTYMYDFGDSWEFKIEREAIRKDYKFDYPTLIKYKGDNLVEDIGGVWGYYDWLDRVKGKTDEEIEEDEFSWGHPSDYEFDPEEAKDALREYTCPDKFVAPPDDDDDDDDDDEDDDGEFDPEELMKYMSDLERIAKRGYLPKNADELDKLTHMAALVGVAGTLEAVSENFDIDWDDLMDALDMSELEAFMISIIHYGGSLPDMDAEA